MLLDDYNTLNEIVRELRQEAAEIDAQIEYNNRCIREADKYVNKITRSESDDYRVFSPRKPENLYKDEINRTIWEKSEYEEQNRNLVQKKDIIYDRIHRLEKILKCQDCNIILLNIQEEDRQRIARELHDTSLQNLTHLIHKIELSSAYIDKDSIQAKLELSIVSKCLREVIDEIRSIIFDLRPMIFDDLGLKNSIERLLIHFNESGQYEIISDIDDVSCENNLILLTIYRIIQESLNNIEKHSEADKIVLSCKNRNGEYIIDIKDNGKGFETNSENDGKHFGIALMKERVELLNGNVKILSKSGKGTRICIEIPL